MQKSNLMPVGLNLASLTAVDGTDGPAERCEGARGNIIR